MSIIRNGHVDILDLRVKSLSEGSVNVKGFLSSHVGDSTQSPESQGESRSIVGVPVESDLRLEKYFLLKILI